MLQLRLFHPTASSFLLPAILVYILCLPIFLSENFVRSSEDRTSDEIATNNSTSSVFKPSRPHSVSTILDSSLHTSTTSPSRSFKSHSRSKRHRRHATGIPPTGTRDEEEEEEEERVPYGPIWTGSRDTTCDGCNYNEIMRRSRIESIKEDLLRKLKMVSPPNITAPRYFSNFKNIIQSRTGHVERSEDSEMQNDAPAYSDGDQNSYDDADKSTAMRVFNFCQGIHISYMSNISSQRNHEYSCSFTFQSHILRMEAVTAFVGIYVEKTAITTQRPHHRLADSQKVPRYPFAPTLYLFKILPNGEQEIFGKKKVHFGLGDGVWLEIDARPAVQDWLTDPSSNFGMNVRLDMHHRDSGSYRVVSPHSVERDSDVDHKPFVDVTLKDSPRSSRPKRSASSDICEELPEERECCRYPLIINFTEYRWDFIVHPRTYNAYYCAGICTTALRLTNPHSHVSQQSENSLCCSPKLYAPLILIYTDSESRVTSEYLPSMIAERCGCS